MIKLTAAFRQLCYYTRYHRQCPGNGCGRNKRIFSITVIAGSNRHLLIVFGVISARIRSSVAQDKRSMRLKLVNDTQYHYYCREGIKK